VATTAIQLRHALQVHASRRHRISRAHYYVHNWPAYEAGLERRGDLTLWIDEAALDAWLAPRRNTPGGQAIYSDLAIEMVVWCRRSMNTRHGS